MHFDLILFPQQDGDPVIKISIFLIVLCLGTGSSFAQSQPETLKDSTHVSDVVDLSGEEETSSSETEASHILARPWYQNIDIWGFAAFWFADSGKDGTRPHPGFVIKESTLFVEAHAWEDMSIFFELQTTGLQRDQSSSVRPAELYAHFRNVLKKWGDGLMNIKVGRVDIPFGEEYLWQDAPDNPLISNSAVYPWLWDEGIALYGTMRGLGWVVSITDGTLARSQEENLAKAITVKLYATPWKPIYLSASFMKNGQTARGPLLLGGSFFQPVGADEAKTSLGVSPSKMVDAILYQANATLKFSKQADLELSFGKGLIDDQNNTFDRDLTWFTIQPRLNLSPKFYAVGRYSEIGTYDANMGYHFGGEFLAGGNQAYGYDARRLQRFSGGLGWKLNSHLTLKLEVGRDRYEVIDASPLDPTDDDRKHAVAELVMSF